jgi:hypothetical protein
MVPQITESFRIRTFSPQDCQTRFDSGQVSSNTILLGIQTGIHASCEGGEEFKLRHQTALWN